MNWRTRSRSNAIHTMGLLRHGIWLLPMLVLGVMPVTWASVYECRNQRGEITLTDSPSQLEQCRIINTAPPSLANKPSYPNSPPSTDSISSPTPFTPDVTPTPAPDLAPDPQETSAPQPSVASPAAPAAGIAIHPIHPFFQQSAAPTAGIEQKP